MLFKARSFTEAMLWVDCSLLGTDDMCGQMSKHIFVPNGAIFYPTAGIHSVFSLSHPLDKSARTHIFALANREEWQQNSMLMEVSQYIKYIVAAEHRKSGYK